MTTLAARVQADTAGRRRGQPEQPAERGRASSTRWPAAHWPDALPRVPTRGRRYSQALRERFGRHHRQLHGLYPLPARPRMIEAAVRACGRDERVFYRFLSVGLGDGSIGVRDLARFAFAARANSA